jgi:hypothetical protein
MSHDFWGPPAPNPVVAAQSPIVCRHFLSARGCLKPDCAFLHPSPTAQETPVCSFFLRGACTRSSCPFRHEDPTLPPAAKEAPTKAASLASFLPASLLASLPPPTDGGARGGEGEASGASVADLSVEDWLLATSLRLERLSGGEPLDAPPAAPVSAAATSEALFPSLPSSASPPAKAPTGSTGARAAAAPRLGTKLALDALARAYPGLPAAELATCLQAAQGLVSRAQDLITQRNPGVRAAEGAFGPIRVATASSTGAAPAPAVERGEAIARAIAGAVARVATGCSLSKLYASCRAEAEALARARNEAFERASRAFAAGAAANARAFSAQGQALDRRMRQAHKAAAAKIFEERNKGESSSGGGGGGGGGGLREVQVGGVEGSVVQVRLWDLHGLHAAEAVPLVEEGLLGGACKEGEWVCLLTGARNHSSSLGRGGGSLNDPLVEHLRCEGWRVFMPIPGCVCVQVSK